MITKKKKVVKKTAKKLNTKPIRHGTLVTLVLDETGSMQMIKTDTIGGYNEYINTLKKEGKDIKLTLTKFDSNHVTKVHDQVDIKAVPELNDETYRPGAGTPLYDAIAKTIKDTNDSKRNVLCVILTDGEENASIEHNCESVKKLIEEKQAKGWTFIYLGANQDAWGVGCSIGITKGNVKNYKTKDIISVFGSLAMSNASYSTRASMVELKMCNNVFGQDVDDPNLQLSSAK